MKELAAESPAGRRDKTPGAPRLSVIIITQNEAHLLGDCLASVAFADEIIIVDGESTDDTQALCREFAEAQRRHGGAEVRLFVRPWPGFAAQKQFALEQARGEWVLSLDTDERVTPALAAEIQAVLQNPRADGYYIPRLSTFLGKFMRHGGWYPGHQLRLFRAARTRVSQKHAHEGFLVTGTRGYLQHDLLHDTHRTLEESLARMNRYSSLEARDRAGRRVHWWDFFFRPLAAFWNKFVAHHGWRDGQHGLVLALVTAMVKLALYLKLWEAQQNTGAGRPPDASPPD
ncbi:MAG: glycosyltransferase family 2 protein [candidate division KSB1 bacterium]|nr:glycosyltransferase family 2 protein [candidate division KSB1 bacterium]MDZ7275149.1 glycosyltransferase family 2 protein [candidate division KSB1 bacterium]MDZ7287318.1 glycosyltransferase family 2 protein [candidate division KSB1 bacterium]MDZ7299432.1 glycosyltransferase family 2 protein [candidate division KSB1 bacterium]MDZ7350296.1 glycosyltransferase family 2 protein [candidate division KSB1 bacterium]